MAKAVLLSIRPEWAGKIANGEKTVEVRKNRPKLSTPFRCYIYCTKSGVAIGPWGKHGKVIGEFVCDEVRPIMADSFIVKEDAERALRGTCLTQRQLKAYADWWHGKALYNCKDVYGWQISNLEIYDKPKALTEFHTWEKCKSCSKSGYESTACIYDENCMVPVAITKAPQSWCYVEELENG